MLNQIEKELIHIKRKEKDKIRKIKRISIALENTEGN
jgi:hypothetical protein